MAIVTKRKVDRVGGVGSILVGFFCAWMGYNDWLAQHSLWKVWVVMCVVLIINGFAMLRHASRSAAREPERETAHEASM